MLRKTLNISLQLLSTNKIFKNPRSLAADNLLFFTVLPTISKAS
jgi:hypothetical protein